MKYDGHIEIVGSIYFCTGLEQGYLCLFLGLLISPYFRKVHEFITVPSWNMCDIIVVFDVCK